MVEGDALGSPWEPALEEGAEGVLLPGSSMCTGECPLPSVPCTVQPHTVARTASAAAAAIDLPMPFIRTATPAVLTDGTDSPACVI
ncbi:hypothetical protein GCM10022403_056900 [Streptomyces coacervatus]|uniref:Uncharacterized protein n=1 Tax=Streptomyces coacervatus TaxID=647381 RepID=A0ABP7IDY9_9ACTN